MNTRKMLVSGLMLISVLLAACTPAATAVPPTTIPPTAVPTTAPAQALTTFSPKTFKIPLSVSFGPEWSVHYNLPGKFDINNQHDFGLSFYIVTTAKLADPIDGNLIPFPEDFLSWIKSNPDFDAVESTPVTIGGIDGLQIDATPVWKPVGGAHLKLFLSLSGNKYGNTEGQPDGENIVTDPEQWRFILLNNVNGERLLIILIDGNGHNFEDAVEQSQKVLDSMAFTN
jgi:hypothetical protein